MILIQCGWVSSSCCPKVDCAVKGLPSVFLWNMGTIFRREPVDGWLRDAGCQRWSLWQQQRDAWLQERLLCREECFQEDGKNSCVCKCAQKKVLEHKGCFPPVPGSALLSAACTPLLFPGALALSAGSSAALPHGSESLWGHLHPSLARTAPAAARLLCETVLRKPKHHSICFEPNGGGL